MFPSSKLTSSAPIRESKLVLPGVNAVPDVTVVYDGTPSNEDEELEDENDEDGDIVHDN